MPARPLPDFDEDAAELAALAAAVAEARAETRSIPHSEVRAWLLEIAAGNFESAGEIAADLTECPGNSYHAIAGQTA